MKRNIDLTENRIFSSNNIGFNSITIGFITGEKFPWNVFLERLKSEDELDLEHQRNSILAVGNKETRAKIKFYREMDSLDYCDCCGKRMNLKPWDKEIGLCHGCNNHLSKEDDKCIWRKRTKEIIRNAPII